VDKEVNTSYLFEHPSLSDTRFVFPKADPQTRKLELFEVHSFEEHLEKGTFDIVEPIAHDQRKIHLSEIDVVLVPGLVFDQIGHRIGFGGGYFDRFLSITELRATTIGLAYSFQVINKLPAEEHDQPLNYVLTETDLNHHS
jgi:5-formyltetrahydrofolate cyclo-ligase